MNSFLTYNIKVRMYSLPGDPKHEQIRTAVSSLDEYAEKNYLSILDSDFYTEHEYWSLKTHILLGLHEALDLYACILGFYLTQGLPLNSPGFITPKNIAAISTTIINFSVAITILDKDVERYKKIKNNPQARK